MIHKIEIRLPNYREAKARNRKIETGIFPSAPLGYPFYSFRLRFLPNGLRFTQSFGKCLGIWLWPVEGASDPMLKWPVTAKFSFWIKNPGEQTEHLQLKGTKEWDKGNLKGRYPHTSFDLDTLFHDKIEEAGCIDQHDVVTVLLTIETEDRLYPNPFDFRRRCRVCGTPYFPPN